MPYTVLTVGVNDQVAEKLSALLAANDSESIQTHADNLAAAYIAKIGLSATISYTATLMWQTSQRRSDGDGRWNLKITFIDPEVDSATICAAANQVERCEKSAMIVTATSTAPTTTAGIPAASSTVANPAPTLATFSSAAAPLTAAPVANAFSVNFVIAETCYVQGSAKESLTRTAVLNAMIQHVKKVPTLSAESGAMIADLSIYCAGRNLFKVSVYFLDSQLANAVRQSIPFSLPLNGRVLNAQPISVLSDKHLESKSSMPTTTTTTTSSSPSLLSSLSSSSSSNLSLPSSSSSLLSTSTTSSSSSLLLQSSDQNEVFVNNTVPTLTAAPTKAARSTGATLVLVGVIILPLSIVIVCVVLFLKKNRALGRGDVKLHWNSRSSAGDGYGVMSNFVVNSGAGADARASGLTERALSWDDDIANIMQPLSSPITELSRQNPLFQPSPSAGWMQPPVPPTAKKRSWQNPLFHPSTSEGQASAASSGLYVPDVAGSVFDRKRRNALKDALLQQRAQMFANDPSSKGDGNPARSGSSSSIGSGGGGGQNNASTAQHIVYDTATSRGPGAEDNSRGDGVESDGYASLPPESHQDGCDFLVDPISSTPRPIPKGKHMYVVPDQTYTCPDGMEQMPPPPPPLFLPAQSRIPGVGGIVSRVVL